MFLMGVAGGFPVGAQCVTQSLEQGGLDKRRAERLLGFCNNCSPAFLFGIVGTIFADASVPLVIFLIQLETALAAASVWATPAAPIPQVSKGEITLSQAVSRAVRSMVSVCAWVVLAGVVTGFLNRWLFPLLPEVAGTAITGLLELTGGVLRLSAIENASLRMILCTVFVCFGGVSVLMQIQSIASAQGLSIRICIRQKLFQALTGGLLAAGYSMLGPAVLLILPGFLVMRKIAVEITEKALYNSSCKGG